MYFLLKQLALPPSSLLILALLGLLLRRRLPRLGIGMAYFALAALFVLSTPYVGQKLLASLEGKPLAQEPAPSEPPQAIVVLGGDFSPFAPEYEGQTVGRLTLERLRYAARLYRETGLPVVVSAGQVSGAVKPVGDMMRETLIEDYGVPVAWTENRSLTTRENAQRTAEILAAHNIHSVYLVTHAWHMPRALLVFRNAGLNPTPAPTAFTIPPTVEATGLIPSVSGLQKSFFALHEIFGWLYYELRP